MSRFPLRWTACLVLVAALAMPTAARAGTGRQIMAAGYFTLAGLQIPAVAFEFVAYSKLHGQLGTWQGSDDFASKASSAANGNLVGGILHTTKFLTWTLGGLAAMADDNAVPLVMVLVAGGLDMANAIIGITGGAVILGAKGSANIGGTPMNEAATWSGVVHIVFGSIAAAVTLPELLVGLFGTIALAERQHTPPVRLALTPNGVFLAGRF